MYPKEVFKPNGEKKCQAFGQREMEREADILFLWKDFTVYPTGKKQGNTLVPSIRRMSFSHQTLKSSFHIASQKWLLDIMNWQKSDRILAFIVTR